MTTALANRRYRLGLSLFIGTVRWLRWYLLGWIVLTPILSVVFSSAIETGLWSITASVFQWFVAATAGIWIFSNLPSTLARGVTRRELTVAYLVFGALASVATAAATTAGFAAEHALLALVAEPAGTLGEALGSGARYLLITPIYFFAGTLLGVLAARFSGNTWFTAAVLVGTGGLYAAVLSLEFNEAWFDPGQALAAWTAAALALTAALVTASALALRTIPIRAKRA